MPMLATRAGLLFVAQHGPTEGATQSAPSLPMVCIHGAGGTHQHWGYQWQHLSRSTQVIAPDLPGHGRSPGPGCRTIADYSAVLLAMLDALDLEQVLLAGHSMGGAIALWTALVAPTRVAGLALIGTGARLPILPALLEGFERDPSEAVRLIVERAYGPQATPELRALGAAAFQQIDPLVFHGDLQACQSYTLMEQICAVQCPTLVLCGSVDQVTPPKFSQYLHTHIHGSRLVLVPHAGHMVLLEQPETVYQALAGLVREILHKKVTKI